MTPLGSFKVNHLSFGVIGLSDNRYKIQVPSMGTQKSAFHVAPEVYATVTDNVIVLTGLPSWHTKNEAEIIEGIKNIIARASVTPIEY